MFEYVGVATEGVRAALAQSDVSDLAIPEATEMLSAFSGLVKVAQAGQALAAGALKAASIAALGSLGARQASGAVSGAAGISSSAAESLLDLSSALAEHALLKQAFVAGDLSTEEAKEISKALGRNGSAEESLLGAAQENNFSHLRHAAAGVQDPDPGADEARAAAARAKRRCRSWVDDEGMGHLKASGPTDAIAILMAAVQSRADSLFSTARSVGTYQPPGSYQFDALVDLVGRGADPASGTEHDHDTGTGTDGERLTPSSGVGPRARVDMLIRVDFDALLQGYAAPGQTCEIAGIGPVPVCVARSYLGEAALKFILTQAVDIKSVAHCGRHVNSALRSALAWKFRSCIEPGCGARLGLEIDHIHPWAQNGPTELSNLAPRCRMHHREKTKWDYPEGTAAYRRANPKRRT